MTTSKIDTLFGKMGFLKEVSLAQLEKTTPFTRQQIHNMIHTLVKENAVKRRKGTNRLVWYTRVKKTRQEQRVHRGSGEERAGVNKKENEWDVPPPPPHTGAKGAKERVVDNLNGKHAETDTQLQKAFREAVETKPAPSAALRAAAEPKEITKKEVLAACEAILDNIAIVDTFVRKAVAAVEKRNLDLNARLAKIEKNLKKMLGGEETP